MDGSRRSLDRRAALLLAGLLAAGVSGCRAEGEFPSRPIVLLVPWGAGGGTDRVSRQLAVLLEEDLGVKVNVVNATGGQGVTGHSRGALAPPDGYTMTMATVELNMLHWRGLTTVTRESFDPLVLLNRDAAAVFVRADAPWHNLEELARHIEDSPGALRASGTAQGGIWHLAFAGWYAALGEDPAELRWLSSQGAASAMTELLAGTVDVVCSSLPEAAVQIEAGQVRPLGVMAPERVTPLFPDVPTFGEQGYDWSMGGWRAVAVPRDTPPAIRGVLADALKRAARSDEFRDFMNAQGFDWRYEDPETAAATLAEADRVLGELILSEAFASIRKGRYGAMVYPTVLAVLFLGLLAALALTGGLEKREPALSSPGGGARFAEGVAAIVVFVVLVRPLGFVATAALLVAFLAWRLGLTPARAAVLAAVVVPATYVLFGVLLRVDLPRGPLGW